MRYFLYPNEYPELITKWEKKAKDTINPIRRKEYKDRAENLTAELYSLYPEVKNMTPEERIAYLDEMTDQKLRSTTISQNEKGHKGFTKIKDLEDGTFFYVNNGGWQGYVTTEDGKKICYAGATKENPTREYVNRFEVNDSYELNIDIL